jgi:hypothetical protein
MAPLALNLTDRYYVDYEGVAGKHTIMFRFTPETVFEDAVAKITSVIQAMKTWVGLTTTFNNLRVSQSGTVVSFPAAWTPIIGTNNAPFGPERYPQFISWVGRDFNGIRVRYTVHGAVVAPDSDYRVLANENANVLAVLNALKGGTTSLVTAGGTTPVLNNYANFGYNAYFQRKRRKVA